jgi:hypothetical protein
MALSGHSETIYCLSAFGGEADMDHGVASAASVANDPLRSSRSTQHSVSLAVDLLDEINDPPPYMDVTDPHK